MRDFCHCYSCSRTRHIGITFVCLDSQLFEGLLNFDPEHKDALPPLNKAQTIKLKHLSIVSLAAERRVSPIARCLDHHLCSF
jgi:hypothetical protein